MIAPFRWIAVAGLLPFLVSAQPLEINDFFNSSNRCDYLIVVPPMFVEGAGQLARYRNEFVNDDVTAARFVTMQTLTSQFPRMTVPPDTILRESIAWALKNWALQPSYIVFIGDDSVKYVPGDSLPHHGGPMPTHIRWERNEKFDGDSLVRIDTIIEYGDNWFFLAGDTANNIDSFIVNPLPAFGRIPCEKPEHLTRYMEKVKQYDALGGAPWRNRILVLTDNNWQLGRRDPIDHVSCTNELLGAMTGRFEKPLFLSRYPVDAEYAFPAGAKTAFFSGLNDGCGWTVYFGHGHPVQLTDERFLSAADNRLFDNPQKPTVMFSMSCSNGAFYRPVDSSMCKAWLFAANGGAVAYIASPVEEYAYANTRFMKRMAALCDSLPGASIGKLVALRRTIDESMYGPEHQVLGDPALRASFRRIPMALQPTPENKILCLPENGYANGDSLYWECSRQTTWRDAERGVDLPVDTVLCFGTARYADGKFSFSPQVAPGTDTLKLVAYAWNRSGAESCGELAICRDCATGTAADRQEVAGKTASATPFRIASNSSRSILFSIDPQHGAPNIAIFRLDGRQAAAVAVPAGSSRFQWDRTKLTAGTYIAYMRTGSGSTVSTRFILP